LKLSKWQLQLMKPRVVLPKLAPWITEIWRQSSLKKAKRTCWLNKVQNTDLISHFFCRIATWKMPHCLGDTHIRLAPHWPKIPIRRSTCLRNWAVLKLQSFTSLIALDDDQGNLEQEKQFWTEIVNEGCISAQEKTI